MSVNSKIYFINKVSVLDIVKVIGKEFNCSTVISDIQSGRNGNSGYIHIKPDMITFYYYENNYIYDNNGERVFDTISTVCDDDHKNALKRIIKYFGGWYIQCDSNDIEIFIEKSEPDYTELTNEQKLEHIIAKDFEYSNISKIVNFIKNNSEFIKELNFGKND